MGAAFTITFYSNVGVRVSRAVSPLDNDKLETKQ